MSPLDWTCYVFGRAAAVGVTLTLTRHELHHALAAAGVGSCWSPAGVWSLAREIDAWTPAALAAAEAAAAETEGDPAT